MSVQNHIQNAHNNFPTSGFIKNDPIFKPFILTISNKSDTAISNLDVLGADTYIGNAGFTDGSLINKGVTISSGISEMNYEQFLYQCMQQPFSVSLTLIESILGSTSQISQSFNLNTQDANGNQVVQSIEPTFDPYQQESTLVVVKQNFSIDAFTKLNFSIVNESTVFRIHFYPSSIINLAAGLQGASVVNRNKCVLS